MRANDLASTSTNTPSSPLARSGLWLCALVAGALALRSAGARGELWLDEVWSIGFARSVHGPLDALRIAHDNNHLLNTLYLACVPDSRQWWIYRALSIVCGSAAVLVAAWLVVRESRIAAIAAAVLLGSSFLMVEYGSEARGYAPCLLFALLAWREQARALEDGRTIRCARLAAWAVLGLLAHLTFVHFELALAAWALVHLLRTQAPALALKRFALLHALPLAACSALYFGFVRRMQYGGGDAWSFGGLAMETLSWTFGLPQTALAAWIGGAAVAALLVWHVRDRLRAGSSEWIFTLALVLGAPLLTVLLLHPDFLAQRYFLLCVAVILILAARAFGAAWQHGSLARGLALLALFVVIVGNALRIAPFLRDGRGQYLAALEHMSAQAPGQTLTISSDSDFGTPGMLQFYERFLPAGQHVVYVPQRALPPESTPWFLITGDAPLSDRPPRLTWFGHEYTRGPSYPYSGPSGYAWSVYQRVR